MLRKKLPGKLQFSVDLFQVAGQTSLTEHQQLSDALKQVATEFARHRLPVTWAIPSVTLTAAQDLFSSAFFDAKRKTSETAQIAGKTRQDFALLVDESWPAISENNDFQSELQRRLDEADERQVRISSLALRGPVAPAHVSAAQASQLRVVRGGSLHDRATSSGFTARARAAGLMVVETTATLPGRRRFLAYNDTGFAAKQALYRAMKGGSKEHITIRMADLMAHPERISTSIRRIVALTSKLEQAGRLRVGTLQTISLLSLRKADSENRSAPTRSILRPAA